MESSREKTMAHRRKAAPISRAALLGIPRISGAGTDPCCANHALIGICGAAELCTVGLE